MRSTSRASSRPILSSMSRGSNHDSCVKGITLASPASTDMDQVQDPVDDRPASKNVFQGDESLVEESTVGQDLDAPISAVTMPVEEVPVEKSPEVVIANTYKPVMMLPMLRSPAAISSIAATCNSKWPIRCYGKLNINVNASYGGSAALALVSCAYGEDGNGSTGMLYLLRFGFDGNHLETKTISQCHHGHFGPSTSFLCEEDGTLLSDNLFGTNHLSLMSNNGLITTNDSGVVVSGHVLPINVNGQYAGDYGGGATLILCSSAEPGVSDSTVTYGLYTTRLGYANNHFTAKFFQGEDKWSFSVDGQSRLCVSGPDNSRYSVFHNRQNLLQDCPGIEGRATVAHFQAFNGQDETDFPVSYSSASHSVVLVLCSNSSGTENQTAAAVYSLAIKQDLDKPEITSASLVEGSAGSSYPSHDLWSFQVKNRNVVVTGPAGPCRYAIFTNVPDGNAASVCKQQACLATDKYQPIRGVVSINESEVLGFVDRQASISIIMGESEVATFSADQLIDVDRQSCQFAFHYAWKDEDKMVGARWARVYAVEDGKRIELKDSPRRLIHQPKGVIYTLNAASNTYHALNDITYESEHKRWANFSYSTIFGSRHRCGGGVKSNAWQPYAIKNTHDSYLYHMCRSRGVEAQDEQAVDYQLTDMPSQALTVRVHFVGEKAGVTINGKDFTAQISKEFSTQAKRMTGYTARYADLGPVKASNSRLHISVKSGMICAFAVLGDSYKEKHKDSTQIQAENDMKQKLCDEAEPLSRTVIKKQMAIVGWSQNLLQNASAEEGNMKHWNTRGTFATTEGGHGTERAFTTSHMWCTKSQVVELTQLFPPEYLDTAPEIQVSEWYREGVCEGGFYKFEAALLDGNGDNVKHYESGEIGRIYDNKEWRQQSVVFSGYGPGVRAVIISSSGKDDKFWGGQYGVMMSDAVVRVKRQTTPAEGDALEDTVIVSGAEEKKSQRERDQMIVKILTDNQGLVEGMLEDQVVAKVDTKFSHQVAILPSSRVKRKRKKREIRVFVSSTFRDFRDEREILIKKTFREINALCADRGVFFTYVDLRWGITSEQTDDGKTIAICLQEIDKCRPYFICMMGDRFGWCQKQGEPDQMLDKSYTYAIENHNKTLGWIGDYRYDTSVTQLEILHGALNNPEASKGRVFFYQRYPPKSDDMSENDFKVKSSESEWHHSRQYSMREKVKGSGFPVKDYVDPVTVSAHIKEDLQNCIEDDFPAGTQLTRLQQEKESHDAFADARRHVYIGKEEYFTSIDAQVETFTGAPFVILGESGCGKSALVANWAGKLEDREPDTFIFLHFIGSTAESASYIKLLRRLYEEIKAYFKVEMPIPSTDTNIVRELPTWLTLAGSRRKCVIILDALNQLDDGLGIDGTEQDLTWIPKTLPAGVFIILSTLPGRAMDACIAAGWKSMEVARLEQSQKEQIITDYLENVYGKTLSDDQKKMIIEAPQTNNPLYLKALLDEVRIYGSFSSLSQKIADYLLADTPGDLFTKILERLEADFEKGSIERAGLVRETTVAIWCASRGMSEDELRELLQVPSAVWSPFYLSLAENLVNRNGILNFFHDHLRQAVESKYLPAPEDKQREYKLLADFFDSRELNSRKLEELPYLLTMAGEKERLKATISDLDVFRHLIKGEVGKFELIKAWKLLGDFSMAEGAYLEALKNYSGNYRGNDDVMIELYQDMGQFFSELGLLTSARTMFENLVKMLETKYEKSHGAVIYDTRNFRRTYRCKHPLLLKTLHRLGNVCEKQKDLGSAFNYYQDSLERQDRVETPDQELLLCEALLGLAAVLIAKDDARNGKLVLLRARELAMNVLGPRHNYVAAIINKLGQLAYKQGRIDEALAYFIQDLNLTRSEVGTNHPRVAQIVNDIALVYDDQNNTLAGNLYETALKILLDTFGSVHVDVAVVRYNLGAFYFATNYFSRARYQFQEAVNIFDAYLGSDHPYTYASNEALAAMPN
ncbi:uncharacterized protein LOC135490720 isoform X2 [Lineus longissimus]